MTRKALFNPDKVEEIRIKAPTHTAKQLAEEYGCSVPTIYNIMARRKPYDLPPVVEPMRVAIP